MSKALVTQHWQRILARWPRDLLRPEVSFQAAMQQRLERQFPSTTTTCTPSQSPSPTPAHELQQLNALYSLLENRYRERYPVSKKLLQPASNPKYYDELLAELAEAPHRSWIQTWLNRWKGFLRFS